MIRRGGLPARLSPCVRPLLAASRARDDISMEPITSLHRYTIEVRVTEKWQPPKYLSFQKPEITIGRVPGRDIFLSKGNVSMTHCRISLIENILMVIDLKSTNGTYLNQRRINGPEVLEPEDEVS